MTTPPSTTRMTWAGAAGVALAMLPLDALWLTWAGPRLYRPALGPMMVQTPDVLAAALFYLVYVAGVVAFVLRPGDDVPSMGRARMARRGAGFGLVAYATYDLTNQATLVAWPWHVTLIDLCWGALLTMLAALAGQWSMRRAARLA